MVLPSMTGLDRSKLAPRGASSAHTALCWERESLIFVVSLLMFIQERCLWHIQRRDSRSPL